MTKNRVEAFSDGVPAIVITLLVRELDVPDSALPGSLAHNLGRQWPSYAAYVVSFLTIGIIWINHHAMLRRLAAADHSLLVLNLLLLLTVGLLPFSTALMAEYLNADHGKNLAAVVYGGSYLAMSLAFFAMQWHLLFARRHLLHEHMTPELCRSVMRRNGLGIAPYIVATLGGIISPYVTLILCGAIAVFFALPTTTSDAESGIDLSAATAPTRPARHDETPG